MVEKNEHFFVNERLLINSHLLGDGLILWF